MYIFLSFEVPSLLLAFRMKFSLPLLRNAGSPTCCWWKLMFLQRWSMMMMMIDFCTNKWSLPKDTFNTLQLKRNFVKIGQQIQIVCGCSAFKGVTLYVSPYRMLQFYFLFTRTDTEQRSKGCMHLLAFHPCLFFISYWLKVNAMVDFTFFGPCLSSNSLKMNHRKWVESY